MSKKPRITPTSSKPLIFQIERRLKFDPYLPMTVDCMDVEGVSVQDKRTFIEQGMKARGFDVVTELIITEVMERALAKVGIEPNEANFIDPGCGLIAIVSRELSERAAAVHGHNG